MTTSSKKKIVDSEEPTVILSLSEIQAIDDITEKTVYVEPWNGHVRVRSISKRQMNEIKADVREESDGDPDQAMVEKQIFIHGLVEPKVSAADYESLLDKSATAMETILAEILGTSKAKGKEDIKKSERQFPS